MNDLKYAIVTGTASGIGCAVAKKLQDDGVLVIGVDINESYNLSKSYICDVSDEAQVVELFKRIGEYTDKIDFLVNAAGMLTIGQPRSIMEISEKQWDAMLRVNLKSSMLMIKHAYPFLKKNVSSIVNISSEQSFIPDERFASYAVSKAGINSLTVSAAKEFLKDRIRVNAIAFGTVKTNILSSLLISNEEQDKMYSEKNEQIPFGVIDVESAAKVVSFLLSDDSKYITGEVIRCDGGKYLSD